MEVILPLNFFPFDMKIHDISPSYIDYGIIVVSPPDNELAQARGMWLRGFA